MNFQLRFARPPAADAAGESAQGCVLGGDSGQRISQQRQLHLKFSHAALCSLGENVKDDLRPVKDFQIGKFG